MKEALSRRLSPALVVSLLALFVALGGTGYAAFSLPTNSVGTPQLKNGAVTSKKVAPKLIVYGAKAAVVAYAAINAQHAKTADQATNATHATGATDAGAVGGYASSDLTNVASVEKQNGIASDGELTVAFMQMAAPRSGYLLVNADVSILNADPGVDEVRCRVADPGAGFTSSLFHDGVLVNTATDGRAGNVEATSVIPVTQGVQTIDINCKREGTGTAGLNIDATAAFSPFSH